MSSKFYLVHSSGHSGAFVGVGLLVLASRHKYLAVQGGKCIVPHPVGTPVLVAAASVGPKLAAIISLVETCGQMDIPLHE